MPIVFSSTVERGVNKPLEIRAIFNIMFRYFCNNRSLVSHLEICSPTHSFMYTFVIIKILMQF